jgi:hypothetical protein
MMDGLVAEIHDGLDREIEGARVDGGPQDSDALGGGLDEPRNEVSVKPVSPLLANSCTA